MRHPFRTSSTGKTSSRYSTVLRSRDRETSGGGGKASGEGGSSPIPRGRGTICKSSVPASQKRWVPTTHLQSKAVERPGGVQPFQDGGSPSCQEPGATQRLADQGRPQGRLSVCPDGGQSSEVSEVQMERPDLSISMPAVRAGFGTSRLYKVVKACGGPLAATGD